jgi:DNA-binding transcriptional regulator YhcF (GntR family)
MERAILHREGTTLKRGPLSPLPPITLERKSREPLFEQLCRELRSLIASGAMPRRLPSTRDLGRRLRISRNTVLAAYETLALEGVLESKVGAGTWRKARPIGVLKRADLLRNSQYPFDANIFQDPDGNALFLHR